MRRIALALALTLAAAGSAAAQPPAAPAAPAPAAPKFGPESTFKVLVADPRARALLDKHVPLIMQVFDGGLFEDVATLAQVAADDNAQTGGGFTAEVYAKLLADLAKL